MSPPSTVTQFPSAVGYWLVQAIIWRPPSASPPNLVRPDRAAIRSHHRLARRAWVASALGVAASVVVIVFGFVLFPHQGGTVAVGHHSASGSPP